MALTKVIKERKEKSQLFFQPFCNSLENNSGKCTIIFVNVAAESGWSDS